MTFIKPSTDLANKIFEKVLGKPCIGMQRKEAISMEELIESLNETSLANLLLI